MNLTVAERWLPAKLLLRIASDDEFFDFCAANQDVRFERTAKGEIVVVPPAGIESDYRNLEAAGQLREWARRQRKGKAFGPSAGFSLPSGAVMSPDAAWVSNARLATVKPDQRRKFAPVCPEFVIEVMSPSDDLKAAREKMTEWIANGAELAWLIDGDRETVWVYRADQAEPTKRRGVQRITGEGPVAGFRLDLTAIWKGL